MARSSWEWCKAHPGKAEEYRRKYKEKHPKSRKKCFGIQEKFYDVIY